MGGGRKGRGEGAGRGGRGRGEGGRGQTGREDDSIRSNRTPTFCSISSVISAGAGCVGEKRMHIQTTLSHTTHPPIADLTPHLNLHRLYQWVLYSLHLKQNKKIVGHFALRKLHSSSLLNLPLLFPLRSHLFHSRRHVSGSLGLQ